ncbi:MAG: 50S ribosomal protein L2 [Candidatus Uhrbacteria bacterium]
MPLVNYKPTSAGRRKSSIIRGGITHARPEPRLTIARRGQAGRNAQGHITVRHRGGGEKRRIRIVDFRRLRYDDPAKVISIEYDPNRNARLALLEYADHTRSYIIAPEGVGVGDEVRSSREGAPIRPGNQLPLDRIPIGMMVHCVELQPGRGAKFARGAGTAIQLMAIDGPHAQLKLPSGEIRLVPRECAATIGNVGNPDARLVRIGKAGRNRRLGWRPTVRGKAMNPVDHPHGGGEGRNSIGLVRPKTPWGRAALGVKTRSSKRWSSKFILQRRKK